jgi:hypothetical protein
MERKVKGLTSGAHPQPEEHRGVFAYRPKPGLPEPEPAAEPESAPESDEQ